MSQQEQIILGAVISLTQEEDGTYYAKQTGSDILNAPGKHARGRYEIDCSFGPITIKGWIDTDTLDFGLSISILGISIGSFYGNLKDGFGVKVDLWLASGGVKLYVKNGNQLWCRLDLDIRFDGNHHEDFKVAEW